MESTQCEPRWAPCKITVLKRLHQTDLIDEYVMEHRKINYDPCTTHIEGQEFYLETPEKPEGFCSWAWADIFKEVVAIMTRGSFPNGKSPNGVITCCTDGLRSVIFRVSSADRS